MEALVFSIGLTLLGALIISRALLVKYRFRLYFAVLFFLFIGLGFEIFNLYSVWRANEFTALFLPPHQSIFYFIYYSFSTIWGNFIISSLVGLISWLVIFFLNHRFQNRFFYPEEGFLSAVALTLSGHPGWLITLSLVICLGIIFTLLTFIINLINSSFPNRFSFYYLWLLVAIFVIIIMPWLSEFSWWKALII